MVGGRLHELAAMTLPRGKRVDTAGSATRRGLFVSVMYGLEVEGEKRQKRKDKREKTKEKRTTEMGKCQDFEDDWP